MGKRVYVYWNLHKNMYSVREHGIVQAHVDAVQLRDVTFAVSEAGRRRVLREGRKNVHAGLRGKRDRGRAWDTRGWRRVVYDPYKGPSFSTLDGRPVSAAEQAVGRIVGGRARVYARGLTFAEEASEAA